MEELTKYQVPPRNYHVGEWESLVYENLRK
jgi:hypothetical protein